MNNQEHNRDQATKAEVQTTKLNRMPDIEGREAEFGADLEGAQQGQAARDADTKLSE
ncbi:hypothetical protein ACE3MS_00500 [Paenibacillus dendritiformis]|uniref:hypothetical protein n=1 Tax=Paenibacillus dendritiformis TaxID=130049 RepID=UPI0020C55E77|nr:hypothetical protein [Paenibacillus dendritiformis]CAH8770213.1 hypothetical protein H7S4_002948 [Paenibacillus dendritiformis]